VLLVPAIDNRQTPVILELNHDTFR
jgi:hypothetical protein